MKTNQGYLLVVDDDEMNRDMLSRRLARRGYDVEVAADGYEALDMVAQRSFDLVLLDIMMPGISGLEVLKKVRQSASASDLPIIMATAKDESEDIVAALELGANDYVTKPLDFAVVLARTQTQLSLKRAMEEIRNLAGQLEQRNEFIRKTFGRYLTDEVVDNLLDSPDGLNLGGTKRKVTLLMADLRGFSALSESLSPEQIMAVVNRYLGAMVEVITSYNGTILEFIGDAVFVIFGAPTAADDDTERAVACAMAMQQAMVSVNAKQHHEGLPEVAMGIGIHTGEVVVGNIGSDKRLKYGVVGSSVNLTARIESYTIGGQVLLSETTCQEVASIVQVKAEIALETKGFDVPITVYDVEGIGGAYNLQLPQETARAVHLQETILLQYSILTEKHLGEAMFTGALVKLSTKGGYVQSEHAVAAMQDLKIQLLDGDKAVLPGSLYAKVIEPWQHDSQCFRVEFTFVPPEISVRFHDCLSTLTSGTTT